MAMLALRLSGLVLALAASPALAGDVSLRLDSGAGFTIENSTGAIERLRVDEATGNVSRNGALFVHTTGFNNTFVGAGAGSTTTVGVGRNAAFGTKALHSNTTGSANSAVGFRALYSNTSGALNTAVGSDALFSASEGLFNTAVGMNALYTSTASYSTAIGAYALSSNTTGVRNVALGLASLRNNTTGDRNIAVGTDSGFFQTTGSDNIYLASLGVDGESGQIRIGKAGTHTRAFAAGIRGVTTLEANAIPVLIDSTGQLGTVSSSRSVKREIRDMGDATARLLELRPVTFRYREQRQKLPGGGEAPPEYGLIAEEVSEVFPDLVVYDEEGQPFTVKYHELAPMLLNEMKRERREHAEEIAALEARLARLEQRASPAAR